MPSVTSANAVVSLSLNPVFSTPQAIRGFASDDAWDVPEIQSVEVLMGVDGILSAGFVYVPIPWTFTLQGDSISNRFFDIWWQQMQAAKDVYIANGQVRIPAIGMKFDLVEGSLTGYKPAPDGKKLLQPRKHTVTWANVIPAVVA
jgi:hypothetical protein